MKLLFGDIVVVEDDMIGVIVKSWGVDNHGNGPTHEVYVRNYRTIKTYHQDFIERYQVRHKELDDQEMEWQQIGVNEP